MSARNFVFESTAALILILTDFAFRLQYVSEVTRKTMTDNGNLQLTTKNE